MLTTNKTQLMKLLYVLLLSLFFYPKQDKVLICNTSKAYAYHKKQCAGLQRCTGAVETVTLDEAQKAGRRACQNCYKTLPASNKNPGSPGQCKATTKKGTRCLRSAGAGGYCWQHG